MNITDEKKTFLDLFAAAEKEETGMVSTVSNMNPQNAMNANANTIAISNLKKEDYESEDIYNALSVFTDEISMNNYVQALAIKAKELNMKKFFEDKIKPYRKKQLSIIKTNALARTIPTSIELDSKLPNFPYIIKEFDNRSKCYKYKVSCPKLAKYFSERFHYFFSSIPYDENFFFYLYLNGKYTICNDTKLQAILRKMIESFDLSIVKMSDINETLKLIKADIRFIDDNRVNSREEYINFKNGIYDIKNRKLIEHNYKFISTIQIDSDFDPSRTECPIFDKYLDTLTSGDKEKQTLLLEFMAVCISNIEGKHMKQALFLYGPGDTGKSQLLILTQKLLGEGNYSVSNLKTLEDRFGKTSLFHKRLCGTGDMSFISIEELEVFKSATGGDQINMEFKNKNSYPYHYKGLLWFCTNGLPRFGGDHGDWVYNRMLLVNVNNVIPPNERDSHFIDKVYQEKEAIIQKLIPYLEKVISNNYKFDIPASVKANIEKYKIENSPVRAFITECCEPCPANEACVTNSTESVVYDVFSIWYKNNVKSYGCISRQKFKTELSNYFGEDISNLEYRTSTARYYPLRFTIDSYNKYLQNSNNNFF